LARVIVPDRNTKALTNLDLTPYSHRTITKEFSFHQSFIRQVDPPESGVYASMHAIHTTPHDVKFNAQFEGKVGWHTAILICLNVPEPLQRR